MAPGCAHRHIEAVFGLRFACLSAPESDVITNATHDAANGGQNMMMIRARQCLFFVPAHVRTRD
jgi:hypothetical protein